MAERDTKLVQVPIRQIRENVEIDGIFDKAASVLGHAELLEPLRHLWLISCFPGQILSYSPVTLISIVTLISMAESSPASQDTPAMGIRQSNGSHWRVFVQCRNAALAALPEDDGIGGQRRWLKADCVFVSRQSARVDMR